MLLYTCTVQVEHGFLTANKRLAHLPILQEQLESQLISCSGISALPRQANCTSPWPQRTPCPATHRHVTYAYLPLPLGSKAHRKLLLHAIALPRAQHAPGIKGQVGVFILFYYFFIYYYYFLYFYLFLPAMKASARGEAELGMTLGRAGFSRSHSAICILGETFRFSENIPNVICRLAGRIRIRRL